MALTEVEFDTVEDIIYGVFRATTDLGAGNRAVPTTMILKALKEQGYTKDQMLYALHKLPDVHKVRFNGPDRRTAVHCWFRGSATKPPTSYVPRPPEVIRVDGRKRTIYPDKFYRVDGRGSWWGFKLIKAANDGELD